MQKQNLIWKGNEEKLQMMMKMMIDNGGSIETWSVEMQSPKLNCVGTVLCRVHRH